jgi:predicted transcriptional regulator
MSETDRIKRCDPHVYVTFRLPVSLKDQLDEVAVRKLTTKSTLLRQSVDAIVKEAAA